MRLWSIHPKYLDTKGLVAVWREGLLAQKVLLGQTKGYKNHPQLERFKSLGDIGYYLYFIWLEACNRHYKFNESKIIYPPYRSDVSTDAIPVTDSQLSYEFEHLKEKLKHRDRLKFNELWKQKSPIDPHPLFKGVSGPIEPWERVR